VLLTQNGGRLLRQSISPKHRKELASKIGKALKEDTRSLSTQLQEILADDLVTAFFNRLDVLTQVKNSQTSSDLTIQCSNETFETVHCHPREH
jgi:hypothetical protein